MFIPSEAPQIEIIRQSVEKLAIDTQDELKREHGLDEDIPDIKKQLVIENGQYIQQLYRVFNESLQEHGITDIRYEFDNYPAYINQAPSSIINPEKLELAVWLNTDYPDIANLAHLTPSNFQQHLQGILIVSEEVSHYVYTHHYFNHYGQEPPEWMKEMIGAIDKYSLMQKRYWGVYGRTMNTQEEQVVAYDIYRAINHPQAPEEHKIGQYLAKLSINYLNGAYRQNPATANAFEGHLYNSPVEDLEYLLQQYPVSSN